MDRTSRARAGLEMTSAPVKAVRAGRAVARRVEYANALERLHAGYADDRYQRAHKSRCAIPVA